MRWKSEWRYTYNAYLNSSEWKEKRAERLAIDSWHCSNCDKHESEVTLQVHHLTYKNVGDENVVDDLVTLCIDCHQKQHGRIFA
jgi:5-methylcytosine-specific restriction endonuclease McrA